MLGQADAETLRDGESVPEGLTEPERDAEGERVTDTEPEALLVKGCVVPTPVEVAVGAGDREEMDRVGVLVPQGEGEWEDVTLALRDWLGQAEDEGEVMTVAELRGERDRLPKLLAERCTEVETEGEGEEDSLTLEDVVTVGLRDTLTVRDRLRVTQLEAVGEEERHSVGDCDTVASTLPEAPLEPLTE